jgi:outer membrane protein TolC
MHVLLLILLCAGALLRAAVLPAQEPGMPPDRGLTLQECIHYSLRHTPALQEARLDEEITERDVKISLSGWYPQLTAGANIQRHLKLPVSFVPDFSDLGSGRVIPVTFGVANNANASFGATQTLYESDILLASRAARLLRLQSRQDLRAAKINTVVNVSKAYYDVLLTQEQVKVLDEAIIRLEKQLQDARSQHQSGTVDKTDYQRATIALSNARSGRKRAEEAIKSKKALLKELMGYGERGELKLAFQAQEAEADVGMDTLQPVTYAERIEYQQVLTRRGVQQLNVKYHKWNFLPSVSAFANYNFVFQNGQFSQLFDRSFPTSIIGLNATVPLFEGSRRIQNLRKARLLDKRLGVEMTRLTHRIATEHEQALANYKRALNEWKTARNNISLAEEVYKTLKLQYDQGIKTYLELIIAETDLRTTQLDYYNALYQVLSGKLDLQRALGTVAVD